MNTILGLTCISEELKDIDKKKYSFQTMTRKRFNDLCKTEDRNEALRQLSERILHNCCVTSAILHHCFKSDIGHYRLSSNLCPLVTDETLEIDFEELPDIEAIKLRISTYRHSRKNIEYQHGFASRSILRISFTQSRCSSQNNNRTKFSSKKSLT